jgi:hypothetical protein
VNTWTPSPDHPGYRIKIIEHNGCTIEILRPDLAEEERAKREKHAKSVMETTLKNYIYKGERHEQPHHH